MPKTTKLVISAALVAIVALSFAVGFTVGRNHPSRTGDGLDIVRQAWNIILTDYVDRDKLNTGNMTIAAIDGMLKYLDDPHSSYLEPETYQLGLSGLEGKFDGIGAYVTSKDDKLIIIAPFPDSPAEKAGIKAGDIILEINSESVADMGLLKAVIKIRGPSGTVVTLLVLHENETEPVSIEIVRAKVEVSSVLFEMKGDIAHINITQFSDRTGEEIASALEKLTGEKPRGIILDLRGNPGGLLESVIDVASHFLPDGVVVAIKDNEGNVTKLNVRRTTPVTDLPVVVLVDGFSASGSEVLAGALQDHGRATIAGTRTYGKGSVNILRPLSDGSGLYITIARWLTPNGRLIEGEGIEPDNLLELTGEDAVNWAMDYLASR
ncbi:MAG: hypothetical protein A2144_13350 [Chloroflexi bacterium RBG_16_50_9]|nr:MAG: hypothetical protein A2144_13350 [Chloroflexi bacterium RBG_16_50_9]